MMNILSYVLHTYLYLIYNKLLKQLLSCNLCHADNTLSDLGDASRHDHGNYKKSYCNFFLYCFIVGKWLSLLYGLLTFRTQKGNSGTRFIICYNFGSAFPAWPSTSPEDPMFVTPLSSIITVIIIDLAHGFMY